MPPPLNFIWQNVIWCYTKKKSLNSSSSKRLMLGEYKEVIKVTNGTGMSLPITDNKARRQMVAVGLLFINVIFCMEIVSSNNISLACIVPLRNEPYLYIKYHTKTLPIKWFSVKYLLDAKAFYWFNVSSFILLDNKVPKYCFCFKYSEI